MRSVAYIEDEEKWKAGFSFFIPVRIRFTETDMFGHVNNVSAFIYFEEARIEFLKSFGYFDNEMLSADETPIVADLQCDFHKQIYFSDQLKLYVKANQVGHTSMDIHYMGLNQKDEVCLTGRGRMVNINSKTGKPVPFSDETKKALKKPTFIN